MSEPILIESLAIPSSLEQLEVVDSTTERIASNMGFDESACADLGICVTEAVRNAIIHAHREQRDVPVEIRFERFPAFLRITVRDHGRGFDARDIPDPTLPENLMKPNGRGLLVIRSLMDQADLQRLPDGMQITMSKYLYC